MFRLDPRREQSLPPIFLDLEQAATVQGVVATLIPFAMLSVAGVGLVTAAGSLATFAWLLAMTMGFVSSAMTLPFALLWFSELIFPDCSSLRRSDAESSAVELTEQFPVRFP